MKSHTTISGKLEIIERMKNSVNGNPRYFLYIDGKTCITAPDSALAYEVPNFDGKMVTVSIRTYYGKDTLASIKAI